MITEKYGKYELVERIARGGMAEVFRARVRGAAGFEKVVALKRLHPHLSEDSEMVAMLKDEARLVSNMVHPNICQVFDFDKEGDTYYLAMEYIHGKDISTITRYERQMNSKIPLTVVLYIIRQALTGLDFAHRATDPVTNTPLNIIHRDISPQNVIVSYNGGVKIIDFGIAKAAESMHHTQNGVIKGKFRYMAPEQAMGKHIDHRIDIFAIGIMLYEMLLGDVHSKGASDAELIIKAQTASFTPISQLVPDLPLGLDLAVMKAMSPDRDQRFPSARTFRNALDTIVKRDGLDIAPEVVANYLNSLFPDPYSGGSRVDDLEMKSGDFIDLSPEPEVRTGNYRIGSAQVVNAPSGPYSTAPAPTGSFRVPPPAAQSSYPPPQQVGAPYGAPPPQPGFFQNGGPALPPPPRVETIDFSAPPAVTAPVKDFSQPPQSSQTVATSAEARAARRRQRLEQKEILQEKEEEIQQKVARKDFTAIPPKPREPVIGPFFERLGKAFTNTLVNLVLVVVVGAIGLTVVYFVKGMDNEKTSDTSTKTTKPLAAKKDKCAKGKVEVTIKSIPSEADVLIDGEPINRKTPIFNLQMEMCYNKPLTIRAEKNGVYGEEKVEFPVNNRKLSVTVRLGHTGKSSVGTKSSVTSPNPTMKEPEKDSSKPEPSDTDPSKSDNPMGVSPAGGIGIAQVTCSEKCTIFINGKAKGAARAIKLRSREKPYSIYAVWGDGTKTPEKTFVILPNKKAYVYFGR